MATAAGEGEGGRKKRGGKKQNKTTFNQATYQEKKERKKDKLRNLFKFVSVLLSASVKRVGVSRMRDFLKLMLLLLYSVSLSSDKKSFFCPV